MAELSDIPNVDGQALAGVITNGGGAGQTWYRGSPSVGSFEGSLVLTTGITINRIRIFSDNIQFVRSGTGSFDDWANAAAQSDLYMLLKLDGVDLIARGPFSSTAILTDETDSRIRIDLTPAQQTSCEASPTGGAHCADFRGIHLPHYGQATESGG